MYYKNVKTDIVQFFVLSFSLIYFSNKTDVLTKTQKVAIFFKFVLRLGFLADHYKKELKNKKRHPYKKLQAHADS
jgi:hypothetical protein